MIIEYSKKAEKQLGKISKNNIIAIKNRLNDFVAGLSNVDVALLKKYSNLYRLRVGDYRVIFEIIKSEIRIIHVLEIKHRKEAYRKS
jgi:mRNA interferase RelE/StbE